MAMNSTPLQLLARQQNWEKLKLRGAHEAIQNSYVGYKENEQAVDVRASLDLASEFLGQALKGLEALHKHEREQLKEKLKLLSQPQ